MINGQPNHLETYFLYVAASEAMEAGGNCSRRSQRFANQRLPRHGGRLAQATVEESVDFGLILWLLLNLTREVSDNLN